MIDSPSLGHHGLRPAHCLCRATATEDDEVVGVRDNMSTECFSAILNHGGTRDLKFVIPVQAGISLLCGKFLPMLIHPQFDPVAIHLGPLAVHWYGLMYLLGFMLFLWLGKRRARALNRPGWDDKLLDDLLFYGVLGVVLGGRLGEVLFYHPGYYFAHPLEILPYGRAACPSTAASSACWRRWRCSRASRKLLAAAGP